jgi:hypothetical protein
MYAKMMIMRGFRLLMSAWGFTYYEALLVTGSLAAIILAFIMPVWGLAENTDSSPSSPVNNSPTVTLVVLPSAPKAGENISLIGAASDVDGDPMTFEFSINEESVYRGSDSLLEWVFTSPGVYVLKFTAADDKGGSDMAAISLQVSGSEEHDPVNPAGSDHLTEGALEAGAVLTADPPTIETVERVNEGQTRLVLESRSITTGDPVPAGLDGAGVHVPGEVNVQVTSVLPGYAFAGWYRGQTKVSDNPNFIYALDQDTTLVAYLVKLSVELCSDRLEVPENGSVDLVIRLSALPLLALRINLLEQAGNRSFLVSGAESIVLDKDNWDSGAMVRVTAPGDADAVDGSARLVFGGEGAISDEVLLVERDAHALLEVEVVPPEAGVAFGGGLVSRDSLAVVGVQPHPGFQVQEWQVVRGSAEIQDSQGSEIKVKASGSGLVRAVLVSGIINEHF